ncbi:hypothetical protein Taro_011430 [Colocasia esculenta]|uniref:CCHC-type domain-containing protein n=1 Tax=Colocasia esculenta TaxID=4460 RepID=A0A843UAK5_COLES|nr:hypothetical protein [Colocasia esculenta]
MSVAEYEAQFARLVVYAPHLVGTERLKANHFMDGLRPIFIERLGPHNIQTYTEMVQRAQLVEDTMAKVEGMRGKDNSKPVFVKKGAPNTAPTFRSNNNNFNSNNKRPNAGRDAAGDKRVKMEGRQLSENCKFCDKPGHRAEECWKKLGACLRCGGRDHRIPDCPVMKDQPGMSFRTCWGRAEKFLVAGEQEIIHTKPFLFPVESAATCTDGRLEVDQRALVSTLLGLVSTHCPKPAQKVFWEDWSLSTSDPHLSTAARIPQTVGRRLHKVADVATAGIEAIAAATETATPTARAVEAAAPTATASTRQRPQQHTHGKETGKCNSSGRRKGLYDGCCRVFITHQASPCTMARRPSMYHSKNHLNLSFTQKKLPEK